MSETLDIIEEARAVSNKLGISICDRLAAEIENLRADKHVLTKANERDLAEINQLIPPASFNAS